MITVHSRIRHRPNPDSYLTPGGAVAAGAYPGSPPSTPTAEAEAKLSAFLDAGITAFIDLTGPPDPLAPYATSLQALAEARGLTVTHERFHIPDMGVCDTAFMHRILDTIDEHVAAGRGVYVHCWGGVGRTGTVIGCWLVRHGTTGDSALQQVLALFKSMSPEKWERHKSTGSPQTDRQRQMVRDWAQHDTPPLSLRDRMRGALIGLAVGDAVGTTVEFKAPGTFPPVTDMTGGGPFHLQAGDWTDDTSMALCLADSLIERQGFDPHDQMTRYVRWWREGYLSSTHECFDIGNTVRAALRAFEQTGEPFSGPTDEFSAGNGSLMRLAPVPLFYVRQPEVAIAMAAESSRTTHGANVAVDACRYMAALIVGALQGATREELCSPLYTPVPGYWDAHPLHEVIANIASGSFTRKSPPAIRGSGYAAHSLEAALWAFHHAKDFRDGCLLAVNLGEDADTTAAVYGQLAGAFFGESGIPHEWRARLTKQALLDHYANALIALSHTAPGNHTST